MIEHEEMLELKRWNTPTIYNGWEQLTSRDAGRDCFNLEETHDFMPQMGSMVGRAVTVVIEPGNAEHQKKNLYDERMKLQGELGGWLSEIEEMDAGYRAALWGLLTEEQRKRGNLPEPTTRVDVITFMLTYSLTAIGLCLLLGLFTRPAAFGGGCFMLFVVLAQPAWPTIYPHAPPVVGHALLINRDFVEMLALFTVATTAAGRWCGLDYFVENYIVNLFRRYKGKKTNPQEEGKA